MSESIQFSDNSKSLHLLTNRASILFLYGEYDRAIKDCDDALALNGNSLKAYFYKASSYYQATSIKNYTIKAIDTI